MPTRLRAGGDDDCVAALVHGAPLASAHHAGVAHRVLFVLAQMRGATSCISTSALVIVQILIGTTSSLSMIRRLTNSNSYLYCITNISKKDTIRILTVEVDEILCTEDYTK